MSLRGGTWTKLRHAIRTRTGVCLPEVMRGQALEALRTYRQSDHPGGELFDEALCNYVIDHAGIGSTWFSREPASIAELVENVRRNATDKHVRVWSVGCSSGEEPYSLAMALLDAGLSPQILATDINRNALGRARIGRYPNHQTGRLPQQWRNRYVDSEEDGIRVVSAVRERVQFKVHNVVMSPEPPRGWGLFDAICCRNVLMYTEPGTAARTAARLARQCRAGGLLLVGAVERPLLQFIDGSTNEHTAAVLTPSEPTAAPPSRPRSVTADLLAAGSNNRKRDEVYARAAAQSRMGNLEQALRIVGEYGEHDPLSPQTHLIAGLLCERIGRIDRAISSLRSARFLDDFSWTAPFALGRCLDIKGNTLESDEAYRHALLVLNRGGGSGLPSGWTDICVDPEDLRRFAQTRPLHSEK